MKKLLLDSERKFNKEMKHKLKSGDLVKILCVDFTSQQIEIEEYGVVINVEDSSQANRQPSDSIVSVFWGDSEHKFIRWEIEKV
jgi:hypothetical protein